MHLCMCRSCRWLPFEGETGNPCIASGRFCLKINEEEEFWQIVFYKTANTQVKSHLLQVHKPFISISHRRHVKWRRLLEEITWLFFPSCLPLIKSVSILEFFCLSLCVCVCVFVWVGGWVCVLCTSLMRCHEGKAAAETLISSLTFSWLEGPRWGV